MRRWTLGTPEERQELDGRLVTFTNRFGNDDLVRLALVLRAFNALARGELEPAMDLVRGKRGARAASPLFGPAGTTRDLAMLVAGAVERRSGEPHKALLRLHPMLHKMLDGFATNLLDEELVHAALGAHMWLDAVRFLEVWRQEAEPGSERYVQQRVREVLAKIPQAQLLEALEVHTARGHDDEDHGDDDHLIKGHLAHELAHQLAILAVENRDVALARHLVERHKTLLGSYGEAVARLAVDTTRGKVRARTVGVLLSLRTGAMRRRSVDVASGMSYGLRTQNGDARLVTRDADGEPLDVVRAMSELAGAGAAVIVAGIDPLHSEAAAKYAADHNLPVLLLTPDPTDLGELSSFIFFVGADPSNTTKRLVDVLRGDGAKVIAGYGAPLDATDASLGVGLVRGCDGSTTAADLKAERVDAVIAYDGSYCSSDLYELSRAIRARVGVGLGTTGMYPTPRGVYALSAGVFPIRQGSGDVRLRKWLAEGRQPPSWWSALARDAAVLAYQAVADLEETAADDETGVRARRQQAAVALAQARATLWTTEASGFLQSQRMSRTISVVQGGRGVSP